MMQNLIVALLVIAAAIYVARRYGPKWLARKTSAWLAAALAMLGWRRAAEALNRESPAGKSCGSCGACADDEAGSKDKPAVTQPVMTQSVITFHRR
jgi:hypothetical protein